MEETSELGPRELTVLHTNDIHGHLFPWRGWDGELKGQTVGGMDRIAGRVEAVRREVGPERVLLLDAGDAWSDTLVTGQTQGWAMLDVMNAMAYDAMTVGNHEPDFGPEVLCQRIAEARFPVLAANLCETATGRLLTRPCVIRAVGGVQVGLFGLAYPNTPLTSARRNVEGLTFLDPIAPARKMVAHLRGSGAQVVIALTHLGLSADRWLAGEAPGIDLIVGGHSHNRTREPLRVGDTLIVQAGAHGSDLGRLDLTVREGRLADVRHTLLPITGGPSDPEVAALLDRYAVGCRKEREAVIARAVAPIARAQTLAGGEPRRRDAESPADDLFADILRESTEADLAFLPGVGYGVALPEGEVTAEALRNLVPHDASVWTMDLSGAEVLEALEQAVENAYTTDVREKVGGMIQVSGLRFRYNPERPFGQRVVSVTLGERPLAKERVYRVAVNGLLAQGGHRYAAFMRGRNRHEAGKQYDLVREGLSRRGAVSAPRTDRIARIPGDD